MHLQGKIIRLQGTLVKIELRLLPTLVTMQFHSSPMWVPKLNLITIKHYDHTYEVTQGMSEWEGFNIPINTL